MTKILDLSEKHVIKGAQHWVGPINQRYHPLGVFGQDSQNIVYSKNIINTTKFSAILLKEWFYLLKEEGYLVIDYKPDKKLGCQKLEEIMWWLWKEKYDILFHGPISSSQSSQISTDKIQSFLKNIPSQQEIQTVFNSRPKGQYRFVCRKQISTQNKNDDINKWTFGIITKGERDDWLDEIIAAIRAQKIPNYEIIVCGTYRTRPEKDFRYIAFKDRDDKGWITKKKNIIARNAKFENLCIIHDRIVLDKNWFAGMKKYGNCFDVLCTKQILKGTNMRAGDWLTYGIKKLDVPYGIAELEYTDWDEEVYMSGQVSILKKSVWRECPWNETRYWGEEDVELSFRFRDAGYLIRFNEFASSTALAWRFGQLPTKYYRSAGLLPKDKNLRRFMRMSARIIFSVPGVKRVFKPLIGLLIKSKFYTFVTQH